MERFFALILSFFFFLPTCFAETGLSSRTDVRAFIDKMADKHQFEPAVLSAIFDSATIQERIIENISHPYEAKPWHAYRPLFVTEGHMKKGAAFWREHKDLLEQAEATYGVPPEMIVAILGIETRYGKNTGGHKVLDALTTLSFSYPPRSKFFQSELEQFLLMIREENLDIHALKGSYAGALGAPQFIPSSYRAYAVDFSGSGKRDLFGDMADVIGSVANYFHQHGWQPGAPVAMPVAMSNTPEESQLAARNKPTPNLTVSDISTLTQTVLPDNTPDTKVALIALAEKEAPAYWVGYNNFYVITRYNHSNLYAMAAFELSQGIKRHYEQSS